MAEESKKPEPRHEWTDREERQWMIARIRELEAAVRTYSDRMVHLEQRDKNTTRLTPLQIQTRDQLLQSLLDLIPAAQRAARRGKPGLLRLICRTLHIKF